MVIRNGKQNGVAYKVPDRRKEAVRFVSGRIALLTGILAALCLCLALPSAAHARAGQKNHWSADGRSYYGTNKKKVTGVVLIREVKKDGTSQDSFYVFDKKGRLNVTRTQTIRKAASYEADFKKLKKWIGNPKKSSYSQGCYTGPVRNGETPYAGGEDGLLHYANYRISTYRAPNGREFYLGASATRYKTRISEKNHSISIQKEARRIASEKRQIREKHGKSYCYDGNEVQHTGWQKIGGSYYYFKIEKGKKGSMVTGKTVNRIRLDKHGKAIQKKENKKRLKTLVMATEIVETAAKPDMTKKEKLRAVWKYFQNAKNFRYYGDPVFHKSKEWETEYAYYMFTQKHGSCYNMGAAFAFLANACGYKECYAQSSGGHGWCQIDGYYYDPERERSDPKHNYYHVKVGLHYKKYTKYSRKI